MRREASWRNQGITMKDGTLLTYERFLKDAKRGCKFKFLGDCAGALNADHDHKTGFYRLPLCVHHNQALGKLGDYPKTLRRIIKILEK